MADIDLEILTSDMADMIGDNLATIAELRAELARVRGERDGALKALRRLRAFPSVRLSMPAMAVILAALPELAAPGGATP